MTSAAIALRDVSFRWTQDSSFQLACPSFELAKGRSALLLGASGAGKSTLLSLICGIVVPTAGRVEVAGTNLATLRPGERDRFRADHIGVIFQQFNLLPYASVEDNIRLPLRFAPGRRSRVSDANGGASGEAGRLCRALRLPNDVLAERAGTLSVGQQQRVAAARALIGQPPVLVADEPTSALDGHSQSEFMELLFEQVHSAGASLLMASHDERLADHFDDVIHPYFAPI